MYDLTFASQIRIAGKAYDTAQITIANPDIEAQERPIPIAWAGTLSIRTDANTGSLTMTNPAHIIATGNKLDLYWINADGTLGSRRGMTAGVVAGAVVPIDLGAGDDLPLAAVTVQAAIVQSFGIDIIGDNLAALLGACDQAKGQIVLLGTGGTVELAVLPIGLNASYSWIKGNGVNPLAGVTADTVHYSHADTVTVRNMRVAAPLAV